MKRLFAIRGAITTENDAESIRRDTVSLCSDLFSRNNITSSDAVSLTFSITRDITALNPATAFRTGCKVVDTKDIPLFCTEEANIEGMLEKVIRTLLLAYMDENSKPAHIYLGEAGKLRPDIATENK